MTAISGEGCRKLAADIAARPRSLNKLVFGWLPPGASIASLQSTYPQVDISVATGDSLMRAIEDADAMVTWGLTPGEWAAARQLVWFQSIGAGVEQAILPGMREKGLLLTNTSGMHATNISEHVLGMMLYFARNFSELVRHQISGEWRGDESRLHVFELSGQTLHVAGYGEIGRELAAKAKALGMRVTAVRRQPAQTDQGAADHVAGFDQLDVLIGEADHVAICMPQTAETAGMFDARRLSKMKPGAYLYNIGRGAIVDTDALVEALRDGHLAGAGLDVTEPEPLPSNSPLWSMSNVLITAHTAGASPHFWTRLLAIVDENIRRYLAGEQLINVVDYSTGY